MKEKVVLIITAAAAGVLGVLNIAYATVQLQWIFVVSKLSGLVVLCGLILLTYWDNNGGKRVYNGSLLLSSKVRKS